jgi:hypothetical protein
MSASPHPQRPHRYLRLSPTLHSLGRDKRQNRKFRIHSIRVKSPNIRNTENLATLTRGIISNRGIQIKGIPITTLSTIGLSRPDPSPWLRRIVWMVRP